MRYPLVDGQGNFGNIDGDSAAAMRYTESRMTDVAMRLLEGIAENAVDFKPTYDGEDEEPVVLPVQLPQPARQRLDRHRRRHGDLDPAAQRRRALRRRAAPDHATPTATPADLMHFVPGPDFPTGGILVEDAGSIANAYETGRGSFRLRARWDAEDNGPRRLPDRRHRDPLRRPEVAGWSKRSPSCCWPRSCRCSRTCATRAPTTSASCWSRAPAPSIR